MGCLESLIRWLVRLVLGLLGAVLGLLGSILKLLGSILAAPAKFIWRRLGRPLTGAEASGEGTILF